LAAADGRRHLAGLAELAGTEHTAIELVAVCDRNEQNAKTWPTKRCSFSGRRPAVFADPDGDGS
jgi:predicted dehydrogenase